MWEFQSILPSNEAALLPSTIFCNQKISNHFPFIIWKPRKTHCSYKILQNLDSPFSDFCSQKTVKSVVVPSCSKSSGCGEDDQRALETVLRLYSAIKNKNIRELSDIIGDECWCFSNFISSVQPFKGKKQVLQFFAYLIRSMGNNIEFKVKPTWHDGMNVGVSWRLEWGKSHVPLGKGFGFYVCHVYHGKMEIRNMEMFMEPILHFGPPIRLKMMGFLMVIMEKIYRIMKGKGKRAAYIVMSLISLLTSLIFLKLSL